MNPKELNTKLVQKAEATIQYLFKGAGNLKSGRFTVGDIDGNQGESFVIYLKDGRFEDFATGEKGDLLEIFTLKYGSKSAGIDAAYSFLGIPRSKKVSTAMDKVSDWRKPKRDWEDLDFNLLVKDYLSKERKISPAELDKAKVKVKDNSYVFLSHTHDPDPVVCGAFYIDIERKMVKGKSKKIIHQSDKPLATIWGHTTCDMAFRVPKRPKHNYVIITEGQIDALSYRSQGLLSAVSVPGGCGNLKWIENSFDWLMKFDEIYLAFDSDEEGQKACEEAAKKIGFSKCYKCVFPNYKDANEAHVNGYDLHKTIENALEFKPEKLVSAGDLSNEAINRLSIGRREEQGLLFLGDDKFRFRIRPKEMTIYTGYPGSGKSTILYQETAYLACVEKEVIVIASLEEDAEDILGLIMIHCLAMNYSKEPNVHRAFEEIGRYLKDKIFFYHHRNRAPFKDVLDTAEYAIRKHGAQHFILDSVAKTDLNIEDNKDANDFVGAITTSMNQTGAHYHVVAHARKGDDRSYDEIPGLQQIKGANAFGVETFNCVTMWRNGAKQVMMEQAIKNGGTFKSGYKSSYTVEDIKKKGDAIFWVNKQKVGGQVGRYDLFYNADIYRFDSEPTDNPQPYAKEIHKRFIEEGEGGDSPF